MKVRLDKILVFIITVSLIVACSKTGQDAPGDGGSGGSEGSGGSGNNTACSGPVKSFVADVSPIFQAACAACHGAGSTFGPGTLITYDQIFNARTSIRSNVSSGRMPLNGSLTAAQKNAIICWIDNGAPNN